jgi:hypothetical protein
VVDAQQLMFYPLVQQALTRWLPPSLHMALIDLLLVLLLLLLLLLVCWGPGGGGPGLSGTIVTILLLFPWCVHAGGTPSP